MNRRGLLGALAAGLAATFGLGEIGQRLSFAERRERAFDNFGRTQEVHVYPPPPGSLCVGARDTRQTIDWFALSPDELKRMTDDIAACMRAAPFAVIATPYGTTWTEVA